MDIDDCLRPSISSVVYALIMSAAQRKYWF